MQERTRERTATGGGGGGGWGCTLRMGGGGGEMGGRICVGEQPKEGRGLEGTDTQIKGKQEQSCAPTTV